MMAHCGGSAMVLVLELEHGSVLTREPDTGFACPCCICICVTCVAKAANLVLHIFANVAKWKG